MSKVHIIAVNKKAQHAVEHFLMARFFHYSQTVMHKTALAFEAVAKALIYEYICASGQQFCSDFQSLVEAIDTEEFYNFTDDFLWEKLRGFADNSQEPFVKSLWKTLNERRKPRVVLYIKDIILKRQTQNGKPQVNNADFFLTAWHMERKETEIAAQCHFDPQLLGHSVSKINIESLPSYMKPEDCANMGEEALRGAIKVLDKNDAVSFLATDSTSLINKMADYTSVALDVFVVDPDNELDIDMIKSTIMEMIK